MKITATHVLVVAGAVALAAFVARRGAAATVRGIGTGYWSPQRQAAYRARIFSEVPDDFYV